MVGIVGTGGDGGVGDGGKRMTMRWEGMGDGEQGLVGNGGQGVDNSGEMVDKGDDNGRLHGIGWMKARR
ncbi:unnamed protein product [Calypogeia fissa]